MYSINPISEKRDRQPNWTTKEELAFVDAYIDWAHLLESEYTGPGGGVTPSLKAAAWRAVLERVNSLSIADRRLKHVKKKWAQLKCLALRKNRENRRKADEERGTFLSDAETAVLNFLGHEIFSAIPSTGNATGSLQLDSISQSDASEETKSVFGDYVVYLAGDRADNSTEDQAMLKKEIVTVERPTANSYEGSKKTHNSFSAPHSTTFRSSLLQLNKERMREEIDLIKLKKRKTELEIQLLEKKLKL